MSFIKVYDVKAFVASISFIFLFAGGIVLALVGIPTAYLLAISVLAGLAYGVLNATEYQQVNDLTSLRRSLWLYGIQGVVWLFFFVVNFPFSPTDTMTRLDRSKVFLFTTLTFGTVIILTTIWLRLRQLRREQAASA
ncbi:MAG: hypothetical protein ACYDBB_11565 [Armatimonadota bacterium]